MRKQGIPTDHWIERFGEWLDARGLLKKQGGLACAGAQHAISSRDNVRFGRKRLKSEGHDAPQ